MPVPSRRLRPGCGASRARGGLLIAGVTAARRLMGVGLPGEHHRRSHGPWVAGLLAVIDVEAYDCDVARVRADLQLWCRRARHPRSPFHLMIAATAVARGRTLVTRDTRSVADPPGVGGTGARRRYVTSRSLPVSTS